MDDQDQPERRRSESVRVPHRGSFLSLGTNDSSPGETGDAEPRREWLLVVALGTVIGVLVGGLADRLAVPGREAERP